MMAGEYPPYSVLMSVYRNDNPSFFDIAMQSMVEQTVPFHEIVLVCDGPLGATLDERVEAWREILSSRLVVVRLPENRGLGAALQAGLEKCSCEYVARMDSDDISRPTRCELLLQAMVEEGLDLMGGAIAEFTEIPGDQNSILRLPTSQSAIREYSKQRNPFNHVSVMFRKAAVDAVGGYKPFYLMEDYYLWVRMLENGCTCRNIEEVLVDVRVGAGMYRRRSTGAYLKSQKQFFDYLLEIGYISRPVYLKTMAARAVLAVLPEGAVKKIYNRLLRTRNA